MTKFVNFLAGMYKKVYNIAMRCLFLYNPQSGKGKLARKLDYIEKKLKTRYDDVQICATESSVELERRAAEAEGFDAVIFAGGDGTFNNVLCGLEGRQIQLGYLPAGTVNDVARSLGIPRSVKGALKVILKGHSQELDCMRVGERKAMYVVAAGAFTSATYNTPQAQKRTFGALAYAFEGIRHHLKLTVFPVKVTSGGETVETNAVLVLVLNGKSVAGFPVNRRGSMADGMLETIIIKQVLKPNLLRRLGALFSVAFFFVFHGRIRKKDIIRLRGESVEVQTEPSVIWDFDGEEGFCGNAKIEVCPRRVKLFVPKKKKI